MARPADGLTTEERAAVRARTREARAQASRAEAEAAALEAIRAMPEPDRTLAGRVHALVAEVAPDLAPRTWYGMPAYARDGTVVCFFQGAAKFKTRYATVGFSDAARLDDGSFWPTAFALTAWTDDVEARLRGLITQSVG